ncbi:MAG: NYN domain-containing protein [Chloroflexota bacterium]
MTHVLVDGYNVIRADPRLHSLEAQSLDTARRALVQTLASSPRLSRYQVVVVFDGRFGTRSHTGISRMGRVEILYSGRGRLADDVIVAQARELGPLEAVVVVTNDIDVREQCRAAGCRVTASENLLDQIPGTGNLTAVEHEEFDAPASLSTVKHGNPRRTGKKARRRDFQF